MSLDLMRKKVELMRVQTARHELELKIQEKLDEIKRVEESIKIQKSRELELDKEIKQLENKES